MPPFINLSNHPSSGWSQAQTLAALALGSPILDVPFPNVPEDADTLTVARMVAPLLSRLPSDAKYVLVAGDFTLTVLLVQALLHQGRVPLFATSRRDVVLEADGSKTIRFRFVQFREMSDSALSAVSIIGALKHDE
jgi:hypothetical protein